MVTKKKSFNTSGLFLAFIFIAFAAILCTSCTLQAKAPAVGWDHVPELLSQIKDPVFPDRQFVITDFGAVEGGKEKCTEAFKKAIAKCSKAGGGRVVVPAGDYLTGPIHLKSNVCLEVKKDATIFFSTDFDDYLPAVFVRWEGLECYNLSPLIYANGCKNIGVVGEGTLNGNGKVWWTWRGNRKTGPYRKANALSLKWSAEQLPVKERVQGKGETHWCPTFIGPYNCKNVIIEGLTLIDGPFWNVHPVYSENVIVRGLTIRNHGPNGDGCNPDSCKNVLIEDCKFDTGDDCIAIKSGKDTDGRRVGRPSENIIVRNCEMKDGHGGVVVGSEMSGGVRNVYAEDCVMDSPNLDRALRIKTNTSRGGYIENVYMRNVTVGEVKKAVLWINFFYSGGDKNGKFIPTARNINMENVTSQKSEYGIMIKALEIAPVTGLTVKNCTFNNVKKGNLLDAVKDPKMINVKTNVIAGEAKKKKSKKKKAG